MWFKRMDTMGSVPFPVQCKQALHPAEVDKLVWSTEMKAGGQKLVNMIRKDSGPVHVLHLSST